MVTKYVELPGVYSNEIDETISPKIIVSSKKVGYATPLKKGYIGVGLDVASKPDLERLFGDGKSASHIQGWHAIEHMTQNTTVSVSRAFNTDTTNSAYFNMSTNLDEYLYQLVFNQNTILDVVGADEYVISGNNDFTFIRQEVKDNLLYVWLKNVTSVNITDGSTTLGWNPTSGATTKIIDNHTITDPTFTYKTTHNGTLSVPSTNKLILDASATSLGKIVGDVDATLFDGDVDGAIRLALDTSSGNVELDVDLTGIVGIQAVVNKINSLFTFDVASHASGILTLVTDICETATDLSSVEIKSPLSGTDMVASFFNVASKISSTEAVDLNNVIEFINSSVNTFGLSTTHISNETELSMTNNTTLFVELDPSDEFVKFVTIKSNASVDNSSASHSITFTSINDIYGTANQTYDILDKTFEDRIKQSLELQDIAIFANSNGAWGNDISVQLIGATEVNSKLDYQKLINFKTLGDKEVLLFATDGVISEQFIVSLSETDKDDSGNVYFIEDVTRNKSQLISVIANLDSEYASDFDYSIVLTNGADGTVDKEDIATAYEIFGDDDYDTALIVTGNGTFIDDDIQYINQQVNVKVLEENIDRYGLFNVPVSLMNNANIATKIIEWFDALGFNITSTSHKYEIETTFFTVNNIYGGKDIVLPASVIFVKNFINVFDTYGRQKAVLGENYGLTGGYKSCIWVAKKPDADDLYVRRMNPVIFIKNKGIVKMGQKTNLPTQSKSNRANVRLKQNEIEYHMNSIINGFVAENTDEFEWKRISDATGKALQVYLDKREINGYDIKCDSENNPVEVQLRNEIVVEIWVDYKTAGERILVTYINTSLQ